MVRMRGQCIRSNMALLVALYLWRLMITTRMRDLDLEVLRTISERKAAVLIDGKACLFS